MEIFVTGGTGNIGQHVTLALLERGHHVRLLTRTPERIPAFQEMENVTIHRWSTRPSRAMRTKEKTHAKQR